MTRLRWTALTAALALISLPVAAQVGGPLPRQSSYGIDVTVTDTAGAPIADAEVRLSCPYPIELDPRRRVPPLTDEFKTDQYGKQTRALGMQGYWRMSVRKDGYVDADSLLHVEHIETVRVEGNKLARVYVQLMKAASLEGTAYLEDGSRVALAAVRLQPAVLAAGPERRAGPDWLVQHTDKDGHYRFPVVPPGDYGMWITPPRALVQSSLTRSANGDWIGYAGALWHPSVEEVRNIVPVTLDPGQDLRGVDPVLRKVKVHILKGVLYDGTTRHLLTRAMVGLRVAGAAPVEVLPPQPVDEKTAAFEFPPLPDDDYDLLVYRIEPGMNLPWPVHFSLEGNRVRSDGLFVITPEPASPNSAGTRLVPLDHVQDDPVAVVVPQWHPWTGRISFRQTADQAKSASRELTSPLLTEVRLIPMDLPEFEPVIPSFDPRKPQFDGDGQRTSYALETTPLPWGWYRLEVEPAEGWYLDSITQRSMDRLKDSSPAWPILIQPQHLDIEIDLQRGGAALKGVVSNKKSEPVANAAVCAVSNEAWRRAQPGGAFCVRADSDGKFRSRWLAPGPWRLWAFPKTPFERPGSEAFETRYGSAARKLEVPTDGVLGSIALLIPE